MRRRAKCWEMMEVLQSNVHLWIWNSKDTQEHQQMQIENKKWRGYNIFSSNLSGAALTFTLLFVLLNFNSFLPAFLISYFLLPHAPSFLQVI